jgi:hypothetical protein
MLERDLLREKRDGVLRREVGELSNVGEVRNLESYGWSTEPRFKSFG